ncbi:unnamed protein product [Gongylonema pulchrum]|uniref:SGNH domain-containing protein n=1 Tax=Gongylonema pulchrum TaxID=637853 RepID=A0A183CYF0_9BILA|nr:unnamed protein product [Gongylonema pulchrum]
MRICRRGLLRSAKNWFRAHAKFILSYGFVLIIRYCAGFRRYIPPPAPPDETAVSSVCLTDWCIAKFNATDYVSIENWPVFARDRNWLTSEKQFQRIIAENAYLYLNGRENQTVIDRKSDIDPVNKCDISCLHGHGDTSVAVFGNSFAVRATSAIQNAFGETLREIRVFYGYGEAYLQAAFVNNVLESLREVQPDITFFIIMPLALMRRKFHDLNTDEGFRRLQYIVSALSRITKRIILQYPFPSGEPPFPFQYVYIY